MDGTGYARHALGDRIYALGDRKNGRPRRWGTKRHEKRGSVAPVSTICTKIQRRRGKSKCYFTSVHIWGIRGACKCLLNHRRIMPRLQCAASTAIPAGHVVGLKLQKTAHFASVFAFLGSKGFPVFTKIHNFAPRKTNSVKKGNHTSCAEQQMLWLGVKCCKKAEKRQSFPALLPYPHVTKACPCLG